MSDKKPDTTAINDYIRNALSPKQKFTVVENGRTRKVTTTTSSGETFEGTDAINAAICRVAGLTDASNSVRDGDETGGTA